LSEPAGLAPPLAFLPPLREPGPLSGILVASWPA
jgi:hypothetical protein